MSTLPESRQIYELASHIARIAEKMQRDEALVKQVQCIGLLEGIASRQNPSPFIERLKEIPSGKQALGRFLTREDEDRGYPSLWWEKPHLKRVFFESGSTIAYVIGAFAKKIVVKCEDFFSRRDKDVLTNNLFALTALADLVRNISPIHGDLSTKYFGFFPFSDDCPCQAESEEEQQRRWMLEITGYDRLHTDIMTCDQILGTCSNFSFLAGPLVGSRGNALTKHAIFAARGTNSQLAMLFHFEKIIPLTKPPCKMQTPRTDCYCVFPCFHSDTNSFKNLRQAADKTIDQENWHIRWLRKAKYAGTQLLAASTNCGQPLNKNRFDSTWIEEALKARLLIALPEPDPSMRFDWLKDEVAKANLLIKHACQIQYYVNSAIDPKEHHVAEILIHHTSSR